MKRVRLYVGTNGTQASAWDKVEDRLEAVFGGFTSYQAWGRERWGKGEPTRVYECLAADDDYVDVPALAEEVRVTLGQRSVLWTVEPVEGGFCEPSH